MLLYICIVVKINVSISPLLCTTRVLCVHTTQKENSLYTKRYYQSLNLNLNTTDSTHLYVHELVVEPGGDFTLGRNGDVLQNRMETQLTH